MNSPSGATRMFPAQDLRREPRKVVVGSRSVILGISPAGFGLLLNISKGGVAIYTPTQRRLGEELQLTLKVPGTPEAMQCRGTVMWTGDDHAGVQLKTLENSKLPALHRWMSSLPGSPTVSNTVSRRHRLGLIEEEGEALESQLAQGGADLSRSLQTIIERLVALTACSGGAIAIGTADSMVCEASTGVAPETGVRIGDAAGLTGKCLKAGELAYCADTELDRDADQDLCRALNLRSLLICPILLRNGIAGVIELFSPEAAAFNEVHCRLTKQFAQLVSKLLSHDHVVVPQGENLAPIVGDKEDELRLKDEDSGSSPQAIGHLDSAAAENELLPDTTHAEVQISKVDVLPQASDAARTAEGTVPSEADLVQLRQEIAIQSEAKIEFADVAKRVAINKRPRIILASLIVAGTVSALGWHYRGTFSAGWNNVLGSSAETEQPNPAGATPSVAPKVEAAKPANGRSQLNAVPPAAALPPQRDSEIEPEISIQGAKLYDVVPSVEILEASGRADPKNGSLEGGALIRKILPEYPNSCIAQRIQGDVILQAHISRDGSVVSVQRQKGNPQLAAAAMRAVLQWRYQPFKLDGVSQDTDIALSLRFAISERPSN